MPQRRGRSLHCPLGPCRFEELEEFFKDPESVIVDIKCFLESTDLPYGFSPDIRSMSPELRRPEKNTRVFNLPVKMIGYYMAGTR